MASNGWLKGRSRAAIAGFVSGIAAFSLLVGGGAAWAYWTATTQATATVKTAPISITVSPTSLDGTFLNTHATLKRTGSFTVSNTSGTPGDVSASIAGSGSLASNLPIRIWPSSVAACSVAAVPASATSGTWASAAAPAVPGVPAGGSVVYCVRTDVPVASRNLIASANGTSSASSTITATLNSAGWTSKAGAVNATQKTSAVYPLAGTSWLPNGLSRWFTVRAAGNTEQCLDAMSSGGEGVDMLAYGCYVSSNQSYEILPAADADHRLITLRPAHAGGLRVAVTAAGKVTLASAGAGTASMQQWWVQSMPNGRTQLVSAYDGKCLVLPTQESTTPISTVDCTATTAALVLQRSPFTFSASGRTARVTWEVAPGGQTYRLQQRPAGSSGNWSVASTSSSSIAQTVLEFTPDILASGTWELRIVDSSGAVIYSGMTGSRSWPSSPTAGAGFG